MIQTLRLKLQEGMRPQYLTKSPQILAESASLRGGSTVYRGMLTVERREKKHNEVGARKAWEHVTVESFSCRMLNDCVPRKGRTREDISPT